MEELRSDAPAGAHDADDRSAPRFTLLIRAAKLIAPAGQFVCVIRDVSASGISLRGYHRLPQSGSLAIELQSGKRHPIERVWERGLDAGYKFREPVEVDELLAETGDYPRRRVRIDLDAPVYVRTTGQTAEARLTNLSQQGACIECPYLFAIEQPLRLLADRLPDISAKVRWREGRRFGLVFDTTFNLRELAMAVARLQDPDLVDKQSFGAA